MSRVLFLAAALLAVAPAEAGVLIRIHNASQRMAVFVNGSLAYVWPVSTARAGYRTPAGTGTGLCFASWS